MGICLKPQKRDQESTREGYGKDSRTRVRKEDNRLLVSLFQLHHCVSYTADKCNFLCFLQQGELSTADPRKATVEAGLGS